MIRLMIAIMIFVSATIYSIPKRVTCYARANLYVYDQHGSHAGNGNSVGEATRNAMLDCGSQHVFGCVPVPGCE
jgi:hypothetical protein